AAASSRPRWLRVVVARAIATTTARMSEAAYACDETAGENHAEVVPLAVAMAKTAMTAKTAAKAEWMRSVRDGTAVPLTFLRLVWGYKRPDRTFSQAIDLGAHASARFYHP